MTNLKIELLEIQLFDHLTVCEQMTLMELLLIYSNTLNYVPKLTYLYSVL